MTVRLDSYPSLKRGWEDMIAKKDRKVKPRPTRSLKEEQQVMEQYAKMTAAGGDGDGAIISRHGWWTEGEVPHFSTSVGPLQPMFMRELFINQPAIGRQLLCRVVVDPVREPSGVIHCVVEDRTHEVQFAAFVNFEKDGCDDPVFCLAKGTVMIIREPLLENEWCGAVLRVFSAADVEILDVADERLRGTYFFEAEVASALELKEQANGEFRQGRFGWAVQLYNRALRVAGDDAVLLLNKAQALLKLSLFVDAAETLALAEGASGVDRAKLLFRQGSAAYGLRDWAKARDFFVQLATLDDASARPMIYRCERRLHEAETGLYEDLARFTLNSDAADYFGPCKVVEVGGRQATILTVDCPRGTLLMASKAVAVAHPATEGSRPLLMTPTHLVGSGLAILRTNCALAIHRRNPRAANLLTLRGAEEGGPELPAGIVDLGRLQAVLERNQLWVKDPLLPSEGGGRLTDSDGRPRLAPVGLWPEVSALGHGCLENTVRVFRGDFLFLYARWDLRAGEEVTISYVEPRLPLEARAKVCVATFGRECACVLCEEQRGDSQQRERGRKWEKLKKVVEKAADRAINELHHGVTEMAVEAAGLKYPIWLADAYELCVNTAAEHLHWADCESYGRRLADLTNPWEVQQRFRGLIAVAQACKAARMGEARVRGALAALLEHVKVAIGAGPAVFAKEYAEELASAGILFEVKALS